ncbi:MAG: HU family DNA-binding protein [Deltaproteobacteria bacterium]|nr:HU family DNA-binding protein [Deltaproteobacteria bacterium]
MAEAKPLTKSQLMTLLSEKLDMTKKDVGAFIDTLTEIGCTEAKKVGSFTLPGFGKLVKQKRKARKGRNPATGEEIKIPAKTVVKFRLAKACKDAVVPPKK